MSKAPSPDFLAPVRSHFDRLIRCGLDRYGPEHTPMWMASIDVRTGRYPDDDARPEHIGKRVYRAIDAPRGCTLYWDQPALVAAHALSGVTGDASYADAADAYVECFLDRCVAQSGLFLWGNHYFYDAFRDTPVRFGGNEATAPCDPRSERGDLHEIRPIPPAWELFGRVSPEKTEAAIRAAGRAHLVDPETGEFNRHADGRSGCAFLESGGILVESLCGLHAETGDAELKGTADKIAAYSFDRRNPDSGLLPNTPSIERWDTTACTTEVGLWAGCLLRAARLVDEPRFARMAAEAMDAYVRHGYDAEAGRWYGELGIADGSPVSHDDDYPYRPDDYADLWEPLFPRHDYPMPFAEACLALWQLTGEERYRTACERWAGQVADSLPARGGRGGYAEHYGRCVHFLAGCAEGLAGGPYRELALRVAEEALEVLWAGEMFRGHPGEERCDAVDGVGWLALALMRLSTGEEPPLMGLGW